MARSGTLIDFPNRRRRATSPIPPSPKRQRYQNVRRVEIKGWQGWQGRYYGADGKRKAVYADSEAECLEKLHTAQAATTDGDEDVGDRRILTGTFLAGWLAEKDALAGKPGGLELTTYRDYARCVNLHLIPGLGKVKLSELRASHVRQWMAAKVKSGATASLANRCRGILRIALNQARADRTVRDNAAELAPPLEWHESEIRPLTVTDARRLPELALDLLRRPDRHGKMHARAVAPVILMVAMMGVRQEEALGLQEANLDMVMGIVRVRTALIRYKGEYHLKGLKNARHTRDLKMPPLVQTAVREWLTHRDERQAAVGDAWTNPWGLVFTNEWGLPLSATTTSHTFKRLLSEAGIETRRFYDLRHGAGTYMILAGFDLRAVQGQLGHTNIQTTTRYTQTVGELLQDKIAAGMEDFFGGDSLIPPPAP